MLADAQMTMPSRLQRARSLLRPLFYVTLYVVFFGGTLAGLGIVGLAWLKGWGLPVIILGLLLFVAALGASLYLLRHQHSEALEVYHAFFTHALEGIFRADLSGRLLEGNPALAQMLGYADAKALVGQNLAQMLADETLWSQLRSRLTLQGLVSNYYLPLRRRDGSLWWARMNAWLRQGLIEGTLEDVSAWQRTEAALRASEALYRSLLEQLPVGVYRSTPEGVIRAANIAAARMLGYDSVEALLRVNAWDVYVDVSQREAFLQQLQARGEAFAELMLRRVDGTVVWVQDYARRIEDPEGQVYFEGVLIDVTRSHAAEQALDESERRYQLLMEQLPEPVIVHDAQHILYANPAAAAFVGVQTPEQLIGQSLYRFLQFEEADALQRYLDVAARRGRPLPVSEQKIIRADGQVRDVEVISAPITYQGRHAFQVVLRDITGRKQYEQQLLEAKERAEEIARLKSTLLSNISHEIRTPLAGIIGFAEVLEEELGEPHRELAGLIRNSGQRLLETLNTLLDLARIEAGAFTLCPEPFDLVEEIRQTVRLFEPMLQDKGLQLKLQLPDKPFRVYLDRNGVHRVVLNLVSNAVKFTDQGEITITLRVKDEWLCLEVSDTGIGIDPNFLPHIFEEFRQESDGLTRTHQGSGLGLAITRRLVEMMDGRIEVHSVKGQGSRFTVWLPFQLSQKASSPAALADGASPNQGR